MEARERLVRVTYLNVRELSTQNVVDVELSNGLRWTCKPNEAPQIDSLFRVTIEPWQDARPLPFEDPEPEPQAVSPGQVVSAARHRAEDALSRVDQ